MTEVLVPTIRLYQSLAIETAWIIEELISLAKEMREASVRGERLVLSEDGLAFCDARETHGSEVNVVGYDTLRDRARVSDVPF